MRDVGGLCGPRRACQRGARLYITGQHQASMVGLRSATQPQGVGVSPSLERPLEGGAVPGQFVPFGLVAKPPATQ